MAGTLNSWSLIVVEEEALPDGTPRTIFSTDFESDDGGFTHSGTEDEWEWGAPASAPITTANSGVNAWKTDLDNTYNASSNQDLFSPEIDLTGVTSGAVLLEWAMKFQLEASPVRPCLRRNSGGRRRRTDAKIVGVAWCRHGRKHWQPCDHHPGGRRLGEVSHAGQRLLRQDDPVAVPSRHRR